MADVESDVQVDGPARGCSLAQAYDVALVDLDGVVYVGDEMVDHAVEALNAARVEGMHLAFVTNNASRPPEAVAARLTGMGIEAREAEVITSAQAAARLLAQRLPEGAKVLVVGGQGLATALGEHGLVPVWSAAEDPAAVVQGWAPDVGWRELAEGAYAVSRGVPWVASNLDRTIPMAGGIAPGNGALVDTIRAATGREPIAAGKPALPMHRETIVRTGARRPLVVGDRLDTDVEGATRASVDSLLVLTGVTSPEDLVLAPLQRRPTYIGHDLRALHKLADAVSVVPGQTRCGDWTAAVEDGRLILHGPAAPQRAGASNVSTVGRRSASDDDRLDALRAACGAAWTAMSDLDVTSVADALRSVMSHPNTASSY